MKLSYKRTSEKKRKEKSIKDKKSNNFYNTPRPLSLHTHTYCKSHEIKEKSNLRVFITLWEIRRTQYNTKQQKTELNFEK